MRFRDFVYAFQRYSSASVKDDETLRNWLSDAYNDVTSMPDNIQIENARRYAAVFAAGQRQVIGLLEKVTKTSKSK